jgi:hypothetical protein
MAIVGYEASTTSAASPATAAPYAELVGNGTRRMKVREFGMFSQAATAAAKTQLGRPAAVGVTPGTTSLGQAQDPAEAAGTGKWAASWGTAPTAPAVALRQFEFNNVVGSGVIFTWPSDGELVVPATGTITLVVWNAGAAGGPTSSLYGVWSE